MKAKQSKPRGPDDDNPGAEDNPNPATLDDGAPDVETLLREREQYLAAWQRAQADYQNLKRRTLSEVDAAVRRSQERLLESILLAVDHLELALASPTESADARSLAEGVRLTRDQILRALEQEGVHTIAESKTFDPSLHQAMQTVESEGQEPGTIAATLRRGYTWGEVVLRPAHVSVVAGAQTGGSGAPAEGV